MEGILNVEGSYSVLVCKMHSRFFMHLVEFPLFTTPSLSSFDIILVECLNKKTIYISSSF